MLLRMQRVDFESTLWSDEALQPVTVCFEKMKDVENIVVIRHAME